MALSSLGGPDDIVTPISPRDERARFPHNARNYGESKTEENREMERILDGENINIKKHKYYNHMSISELEREFGDLSGFEILFVERNPYHKVLSWANWTANAQAYNSGGDLKSDVRQVRRQINRGLESGRILDVLNIERYRYRGTLSTGWRYESLQQQFSAWAMDKGGATLPHAKRGLMSSDLEIREWLSRSQIDRVNELFRAEFEAFGYQPLARRRTRRPGE